MAGFLLAILGIWLLLQTLVGGLPGKVLNLGKSKPKTTAKAAA